MFNTLKKAIAVATATVMLASVFTACSKTETKDSGKTNTSVQGQSDQKQKVKFYYVTQDRKANAPGDDEVKQFINQKFNVDYQRVDIAPDQYREKMSVILASGENMDCLNSPLTGSEPYSLPNLLVNKTIQALDTHLNKVGKNLQKEVPQDVWEFAKGDDGKIYGIPEMGFKQKVFLFVRQDWMDKLKLQAPKTIEEFEKMLIAFRDGDLDGNGKADTYPLIGYIYDGYNNYIHRGLAGSFIPTGIDWFEDKDGNLLPHYLHPNYKQYMTTMQKWYKEKLIHPDMLIMKQDQCKTALAKGASGVHSTWYTTSYDVDVLKADSNAKWTWIPYPVGPSGTSGAGADGIARSAFVISSSTKPEVAERVVEIVDWLQTPEGTLFNWYGIEGKHWVKDGDNIKLPEGIEAANQPYKGQLYINGGNSWKYYKFNSNVANQMRYKTLSVAVKDGYQSVQGADYMLPFDWNNTKSKDVMTDLDLKMPADMYAKVITGAKPVEWIDEWVKEWKSKGGDTYIKEKTEQYKKLKSKYGKK